MCITLQPHRLQLRKIHLSLLFLYKFLYILSISVQISVHSYWLCTNFCTFLLLQYKFLYILIDCVHISVHSYCYSTNFCKLLIQYKFLYIIDSVQMSVHSYSSCIYLCFVWLIVVSYATIYVRHRYNFPTCFASPATFWLRNR